MGYQNFFVSIQYAIFDAIKANNIMDSLKTVLLLKKDDDYLILFNLLFNTSNLSLILLIKFSGKA